MPDINLSPDKYRVRDNGRWRVRDDWRWNLGGFIVVVLALAYIATRSGEVTNPVLLVVFCGGIGVAGGLLLSVVVQRLERWLDR